MNLEQQVCSLELAKRLKELGVRQGSHFYWCRLGGLDRLTENKVLYQKVHNKHWHSAFTVAELGEMLPKHIRIDDKEYRLSVGWRNGSTARPYCEYWHPYEGKRDFRIGDGSTSDTEADARAKMLTYLLENKLVTV